MLETATVTIPLEDFDSLRAGEKEQRRMAARIADCFKYIYIRHNNPEPPECMNCKSDGDCCDCEINKNNPYSTEKLVVDVERLIGVARDYALYGKDVEAEPGDLPIEQKEAVRDDTAGA